MTIPHHPIDQAFFRKDTVTAARELLGAILVVRHPIGDILGIVTEAEAYVGETDLACHCRAGRTNRTSVMYGEAGTAYVYFTYGHHWMLNVVTGEIDFPAAILIRALYIIKGQQIVAENRNSVLPAHWTDGPGKLTKACGIDKRINGTSLTNTTSEVWLAKGTTIPPEAVTIGPRVGLYTVPEPWKSKPWRFLVKKNYQLEEQWDYLAEKTP